jgi:hypothetical protein
VTFKEINHHFRHLKRGGRGWSKRLAYSSVGTKNGTTERNPNFRRIIFADGPQRPSGHHASQACSTLQQSSAVAVVSRVSSTLQQSSAVAVVSRVGAAEPTPPPRAPPCACEEEEKLCGPLGGATAAWSASQTCCNSRVGVQGDAPDVLQKGTLCGDALCA